MQITVKIRDMVLFKNNVIRALKTIRGLSGMGLKDARVIALNLKEGREVDLEVRECDLLEDLKKIGVAVIEPSGRQLINDTLKAFYDGESLDDTNLVKLHLHVVQTAKMLSQLGDRFHLAMVECLRVADVTNSYIATRRLKTNK